MGLYGGNLLVPLPEREKKVCFWLGAKKKICTGEKTIPPTYHLIRPLYAIEMHVCRVTFCNNNR